MLGPRAGGRSLARRRPSGRSSPVARRPPPPPARSRPVRFKIRSDSRHAWTRSAGEFEPGPEGTGRTEDVAETVITDGEAQLGNELGER